MRTEPVAWLLAAILGMVHATIVKFRRSDLPVVPERLLPVLAMALTGFCCLGSISMGSVSAPLFIALVPMICCVALALRSANQAQAFVWALAGMFGGVMVNAWLGSLAGGPQYTRLPAAGWAEDFPNSDPETYITGQIKEAASDPEFAGKKFAPQYYDKLVQIWLGRPAEEAKFQWNDPKPLWHTKITGLYERNPSAYRVWFGGGTWVEGLKRSQIVGPAGSRKDYHWPGWDGENR